MFSGNLYVGIDVHKETVTVAVLPEGAEEPTVVKTLPNRSRRLRRFFDRLVRDGGEIRACYEASGAGYVLQRQMRAWGHSCEVVAPSLVPKRPGHQRKYDRWDATELARYYRAGDLVVIRVPDEASERDRDLVRCRGTFHQEVVRAQHYVLKFLRRRGLIYREGSNWTQKHFQWLHGLLREEVLEAEDAAVLREYLALLEYTRGRRDELDGKIEEMALRPAYRDAVERLACYRGIRTHSAVVLTTEIGDWRRFEHPKKVMAYVGLVPSENSTGEDRRTGSITKAGNSRCRHVLVQAAWSYRRPPRLGAALKRRQEGQPADVIAHSWKAQQRLYKRFRHLEYRKGSKKAVVAVARELSGFLWATMQDVEWTADSGEVPPAA